MKVKLWSRRGTQMMSFGDRETDRVFVSPNGAWCCGLFDAWSFLILSTHQGRVVRFNTGVVLLAAISNEGVTAIVESGSRTTRLRVLWPDGTTAQPRVKAAARLRSIGIRGNQLEFENDDGVSAVIDLADADRRPLKNAVLRTESRSWLWWFILGIAILFAVLKK